MELADGTQITKLLHGVDLVLGMTWLQRVNPLIDWAVPRMLLGDADCTSAVRGQWIASTEAPGTVKVVQDADLAAIRDPSFCSNLEILNTPTFWRYAPSSMPWRAKDGPKGGVNDQSAKETPVGTTILPKRRKRVSRLRLHTPDEPARPP